MNQLLTFSTGTLVAAESCVFSCMAGYGLWTCAVNHCSRISQLARERFCRFFFHGGRELQRSDTSTWDGRANGSFW
jgi:hypothetical protein